MSRTIFIAPLGSGVGKTTFCLGLIFGLKNIASKVGFIKPVGQRYVEGSTVCEDARLIAGVFGLDGDMANISPFSSKALEKRLLAGEEKQALDEIASAHESISEGKNVVIVEGMDLTSIGAYQTDMNVALARRINAQVLLLINGAHARPVEDIVYETVHAREMYETAGCRVLGVVVNKADVDTLVGYGEQLRTAFKERSINVIGVVPYRPIMGAPSMRDVMEAVNGKIIVEGNMRNLAHNIIVAAMRPANVLSALEDNTLIITAGDRDDILLAMAAADLSEDSPPIAGIVLTGNQMPSEVVLNLLRKLDGLEFPVLLAKNDTFKTSTVINGIDIHVRGDDTEKIEAAEMIVETHCDCKALFAASGAAITREKTPQDYLDDIIRTARKKLMHIVLSEGVDERVLLAADYIQKRGIARITLLGDADVIAEGAKKLNIALKKVAVIDPAKSDVEEYAAQLYEARKAKGVGIHTARDLVRDTMYYSAMMVRTGDADGYVSGAIHSTADTLRPALQLIGTAPGMRFVSSVFLMLRGPKAFFYGDCAIIEEPDKDQLAAIAVSSARTAQSFGIEPIVAMLSYSTGTSGKGSSVEKVREAAAIANKMAPEILIEGPVQYDAAFDEKVAKVKLPHSKVAGRANVFIFPDLNSGNIAYKAVQREAGAMAIGPICQGFRKPVNDLSRGCSTEDIVYVTAITAIQAQAGGKVDA